MLQVSRFDHDGNADKMPVGNYSTENPLMSPDKQLDDLLAVLVDRFGSETSLGEVRAISYALRMTREGRKFSVSDVAKATGVSKQSLSRWLQHHVDTGVVKTQPAEDDARIQEITITDPARAYRHLEPMAKILGCEVGQPRCVAKRSPR